jgi:hypothetical protein
MPGNRVPRNVQATKAKIKDGSKNIPKQVDKAVKKIEKQRKKQQPSVMSPDQQRELENAQAVMLAKSIGNRGVAPIVSTATGAKTLALLTTAQMCTTRVVYIYEKALYMAALAVILKAIRKGVGYPEVSLWQAYMYLANVFVTAASGKAIDAIELPAFVWEIIAALGPKKVPFKTAEIQYSALILPSTDVTYKTTYAINYLAMNTDRWAVLLGPLSTTVDVVGFPAIEAGPGVVDYEAGAQALGAIWTALGIKKLYPLQNYVPRLKGDTSVFAALISQYGTAFEMPGAIRSCLSQETFVQCPILSKFALEEIANQNDPDQLKRGFWEFRASGGGPMYLTARAAEFLSPNGFKNKLVPMIKTYDFFDLFERVACWIGRLLEQSLNDNTTKFLASQAYPLTAQQLAIILRQCVIKVFENGMGLDVSQAGEDTDAVVLLPWAVGQQTPMRNAVNMKLPSFLAENIRSIRRYTVPTKFGVVDVVPVLSGSGAYHNVQYTWNNDGEATNIFMPAEGPNIDLIDCSTTIDSNPVYLCLDGTTLSDMILSHNAWVQKFESLSTPIVDLGEESGSCIFLPNYQTIMCQTVIQLTTPSPPQPVDPTKKPVQTPRLAKQPSKKHISYGKKFSLKKVGVPVPDENTNLYSSNAVVGTTMLMNPIAAAWKYQSVQWCPKRLVNHGAGQLEETVSWYRTNMCEPVFVSSTSQSTGILTAGADFNYVSFFQRNLAAAELDIRTAMGSTEWENDFKLLAAEGKGGLVGLLGNVFGTALNLPVLSEVGHAVDSFLPF